MKNGDAVDQVRRVLEDTSAYLSGPDAFVGDFVRAHRADDVLVLCTNRPRRERYAAGRIRAEGYATATSGPFRHFSRLRDAIRVAVEIYCFKPDRVLCGCTGELLWACVFAAKLRGVPIVNSRHNSLQASSLLQRIAGVLDRLSIRACDGVVCHGKFMSDQIHALGVPPSRIWQFGVDFGQFASMAGRTPLPDGLREFTTRFDNVLMFVGRVQQDKGIFDLLEAYCDLPEPIRDRTAVVYVGDGKHLSALREEVERRALQSRVLLLGNVPHRQLAGVMRTATVVLAPTRPEFSEGRCKVIPEALVLGIPVIGPNFGPFPYGIRHEVDGLLFEPGSWRSLAECLARVCGDRLFLQRLRHGAQSSAQRILGEQTGFARAVECAFRGPRRSNA
ncbi:MAG: glycosyltransferase family 4 protein [Steroidobacteraceae bacterium]|nr:glycosyltransferase family 4 protein [Steroidobacteraceae bacterium]